MKTIQTLVAASVMTFALISDAVARPTIVGYIPNQAGSKITFTLQPGSCLNEQLVVFAQNEGGKVGAVGCYKLIDNELFVVWNDGDVYTYSFDNIVFARDFKDYIERGGE